MIEGSDPVVDKYPLPTQLTTKTTPPPFQGRQTCKLSEVGIPYSGLWAFFSCKDATGCQLIGVSFLLLVKKEVLSHK